MSGNYFLTQFEIEPMSNVEISKKRYFEIKELCKKETARDKFFQKHPYLLRYIFQLILRSVVYMFYEWLFIDPSILILISRETFSWKLAILRNDVLENGCNVPDTAISNLSDSSRLCAEWLLLVEFIKCSPYNTRETKRMHQTCIMMGDWIKYISVPFVINEIPY